MATSYNTDTPIMKDVHVVDNTPEYANYLANQQQPQYDGSEISQMGTPNEAGYEDNYQPVADDHTVGKDAVQDVNTARMQNLIAPYLPQDNINAINQGINQLATQDPEAYARKLYNDEQQLDKDTHPQTWGGQHPILKTLIGAGLGAGLGYALTSPMSRTLGNTPLNMALGATAGGLLGYSDSQKAKNAYLKDEATARNERIKRYHDELSSKNRAETLKNLGLGQEYSNKAQMPLSDAQFLEDRMAEQGLGNAGIDPNTGHAYIHSPEMLKSIGEALGSPQAMNLAAQKYNQYYGGIPQSNSVPQTGTLNGGVSQQTQDHPFTNFGITSSEVNNINDQMKYGTAEQTRKQNVNSQIGHRKVTEQQGWARVGQGQQKTKAYLKNVDSQIKTREGKGMTPEQKSFVGEYIKLKTGQSPEIQAKVNQAIKSGTIKAVPGAMPWDAPKKTLEQATKEYKQNLINSYLLKAQAKYASQYGKDIESILKPINKSDALKEITPPPDDFVSTPEEYSSDNGD